MKTKDFIQKIQLNAPATSERTAELVELTSSIIARMLAEGDTLAIQGFGSFEVKQKEERISVNPSTGARWMIPPKLVAVFKPGTILKEKIKNYTGNE